MNKNSHRIVTNLKKPFPKKLIDECLELFPNNPELNRAIKHNHLSLVLSILESGCQFNLFDEDVIKAFKYKREAELLKLAKLSVKKRELYNKIYAFESRNVQHTQC